MTILSNRYNSRIRKLHCVIPTELWGIIFAKNDLSRIDEIVTELLCEYYRVDFKWLCQDELNEVKQ